MSSHSDDVSDTSGMAGPSNPRFTQNDLPQLQPEIIVIGAGIAGTSLSYSLSHAGRRVLLIERDLSQPDRIVGELLQPGGVAALSELGLGGVLEGIDAVGVEGYCVVMGERRVGVPYPVLESMAGEGAGAGVGAVDKVDAGTNVFDNGLSNGHAKGNEYNIKEKDTAAWHVESFSGKKEGRSFHHGRLITSLRQRCLHDAPNLTVLEGTVRDLIYCDHTDRVIGISTAFKVPPTTPDGEPTTVVRKIYAPITIIADGCNSKFRKMKGSRLPVPQTRSHFVGVVLKDVTLPMERHGTVCLTPAGPVLLYQIADEGRETRMLVDVKGKLPSVSDGSLRDHIATKYVPHLPTTVQPAVLDALSTQRLRTMPNSFLPPSMQGLSSSPLSGVIMVGDAWNMRHPLTGGGMTVAFSDAVLLTGYLRPSERLPAGREGLEDWEMVSVGLREWFWRRKGLAGVVNVLSMALYDLFGGADEPDLEILREGCFKYFELGGECVAGPVGLLSALTPKPLMLFYHFFSVAFYSIWILLTQGRPPVPGTKSVKTGMTDLPGLVMLSGRVFWTACVVLLPVIWTEFKV